MKRRRLKNGVIIFALCATAALTAVAAEKVLWVRSTTAKLKAEQSNSSETVAELTTGTKLTSTEDAGRWLKVSTEDGKAGWIYRGKVSTEEPQAEEKDSDGLLAKLGTTVKAEEADTARSIRGLSPDAEKYAKDTGTSEEYKAALETILSNTVSQASVDDFLKSGKIGEYAE